MADVKFGLGQIKNPTPRWAKLAFRWFFYLTSGATIILDVFTEIPPDIKLIINSSVLKANLLVHSFSKLFGISFNEFEDNPE